MRVPKFLLKLRFWITRRELLNWWNDLQLKKELDMVNHLDSAPEMPGWQKKLDELGLDLVDIKVTLKSNLLEELTPEQLERTLQKIPLIIKGSKLLAFGMIKGSLKYPDDTWSIKRWNNHMLSESADLVNYGLLQEKEIDSQGLG